MLELPLSEVSAHYLLAIAEHGSIVTVMSVPRSAQAIKSPAIAHGVVCVRFCRVMDSDNIRAAPVSPVQQQFPLQFRDMCVAD